MNLTLVVTKLIAGLYKIDVFYPVMVIPGQGTSKHQDYIIFTIQTASKSSLVAMKPTVSLVEFFHTCMFFMSGFRLQGSQVHERMSSSLQYEEMVSYEKVRPSD